MFGGVPVAKERVGDTIDDQPLPSAAGPAPNPNPKLELSFETLSRKAVLKSLGQCKK